MSIDPPVASTNAYTKYRFWARANDAAAGFGARIKVTLL
jgi:hypothetical protein